MGDPESGAERLSAESKDETSETPSTLSITTPEDALFSVEPPNGGLQAWLVVLAVFFIFMNTWGISSSYGAWQEYYQGILFPTQSPSSLAWIGSTQSFLLVITGLITGPLFDMGYLLPLLLAGHLLMVLGLMMLSLCTQYYQVFLAQAITFGIGSGLIYIPSLALVTTLFTTKKPFAVGLLSTGTSIGGTIFPIVFRRLRPHIGFPWTTRIIAFIVLALSLVSIALLTPVALRKPARPPRKVFDVSAYKNPAFTFFSLALFFQFLAFWIPFFYIPTFSINAVGTDKDWAYYTLAIANAAGVLSRPSAGYIGHRLGAANVDMFCVLCAAAVLFGWLGVTSFPGFITFTVFWGLFSGVLVSFPAAIVTHPALSPSIDVAGTRLGMTWAAAAIGILVGTPIAGVLVKDGEGTKGFLPMEGFSAAMMVIGGVLLIVPLIACLRHKRSQA